jgi:hypothetical protein
MDVFTHGAVCLRADGQERCVSLPVLLKTSGYREWQLFHVEKSFGTALR